MLPVPSLQYVAVFTGLKHLQAAGPPPPVGVGVALGVVGTVIVGVGVAAGWAGRRRHPLRGSRHPAKSREAAVPGSHCNEKRICRCRGVWEVVIQLDEKALAGVIVDYVEHDGV